MELHTPLNESKENASSLIDKIDCKCDKCTGTDSQLQSPSQSQSLPEQSNHLNQTLFRSISALKIYIYDIPTDLLLNELRSDWDDIYQICRNDPGYSIEFEFYRLLLKSPYRTLDPELANVFFIPHYTVCRFHTCVYQPAGNPGLDACFPGAREYLLRIWHHILKQPYFARNGGADHVIAMGHELIVRWFFPPHALHESVFHVIVATPHGVIPGTAKWLMTGIDILTYSLHKDICLLPILHPGIHPDLYHLKPKKPLEDRKYLVYHRGSLHLEDDKQIYSLGIRQYLYHNLPKRQDIFFVAGMTDAKNYSEELRESRFCLYIGGWVPWSGRIIHVLGAGCVPVILTDGISLPYEDLIDWRSFSIKIRIADVKNLLSILESIPVEVVKKKEENLLKIRQSLLYHNADGTDALENGAMNYLLQSLLRRIPTRRLSAYDSWL